MSAVHHLPAELSSFVGRAEELATIGGSVTAGQVLTLVGPGGCGKTRLAIQVCRRLARRWPGVVWVGLENESCGDQVAHRMAGVLDVPLPSTSEPMAALVDALSERDVILAVDNCEHVLDDTARVVATVLTHCPRVAVLATSRAPLGITGEYVWRVPPMALPDALELFLARANVGDAGIEADGEARAGARRICDRLDRLPLALELAAGWAGTLSPAQIADSLSDPYSLLDRGERGAAFRQQTLEGSMRWSHDLLGADERVLFRWLGAFEPGFAADAVVSLASLGTLSGERLLRALRGLIDTSLVVADTTAAVARYRMLGVVRAYALARLAESGEAELVRDRHLETYLSLVESVAPLLDSDKDAWRVAVGSEYANILAAVEWGLSGEDSARGRRLAAATAWLWHLEARGTDGVRLLRLAAERGAQERTALQAEVLVSLALVADTSLPGGQGLDAARDAQEIAEEVGATRTELLSRSLLTIGVLEEDLGAAMEQAAAVRDDAELAGEDFVADSAQALIGLVCTLRDENRQAIHELEPALDGLLRRGDRGVASSGLAWLAHATAESGDLTRAGEVAERAVAVAQPLRDFHRLGFARSVLAEVRLRQGRLDDAGDALEPIDRLVAVSDEAPFIPGWERVNAMLALQRGRPDEAMRWCRLEDRWHTEPRDDRLLPETRVVLAAALRETGDAAGAQHLLDGLSDAPLAWAMPRVRAGVLAERAVLAQATDTERALDLHHQALQVRAEHDLVLGCIDSLEALAILALRRGADELAGVLTGAAARARADAGAAPRSVRGDDADLVSRLEEPALSAALEKGGRLAVRDAVAYATRARGPRRRPEAGWQSLTPTERTVVELAVQGLSNPEIADRLFMSRGTVKTHLGHVYAKLQVANRTELARLAGEQ